MTREGSETSEKLGGGQAPEGKTRPKKKHNGQRGSESDGAPRATQRVGKSRRTDQNTGGSTYWETWGGGKIQGEEKGATARKQFSQEKSGKI